MSNSVSGSVEPTVIEAPIEQKIRHGAWATFLVPVGSLIVQLVAGSPPFELISLFELPFIGALAFGLYRKSRAAAVGIILYFVAVGLVQFLRWRSLPFGAYIILAFFLGRAIPAVFRYHRAQSPSAFSSHAA
jgi:hypothetical protein